MEGENYCSDASDPALKEDHIDYKKSKPCSCQDQDPVEVDFRQSRRCTKFITVEPAVIGTMFVLTLYSVLSKQYFYGRIALSHQWNNSNITSECSDANVNSSDPDYILDQKVSSETASWILCLGIATFVPELFSNVFLGSWGDRVGRKPPIIISLFGIIILMSVYVLVIVFNLPLHFLYIGHISSGFLGDFGNILGCSFSYLSDVTTPAKRALRMAVLETGIGIGGFAASMTSGLWNIDKGYQTPFWFMLGLTIFDFLYTLCFLPPNTDGKMSVRFRYLFSKEPFVHMYQVIRPRQDKRHIALILLAICFCILMASATGIKGLLVVYTIGVPFCWNSMFVGIFSGLGQVGFFVSLILLKLFSAFSYQPRLVMLGVISSTISSLMFAFAKTTLMLFLAQVLQLFFNIPSPIIRSQASRLVSRDEVGSVFAVLACAAAIGQTVGTVVYQGIFAITDDSVLPGTAFLVAAFLILLIIPLYWIGYRTSGLKQKAHVKRYDILVEEEQE